ncbi:MAG: hypothetical protein H7246_22495 [Phycisphaerae bacterium]|nr:hypothetical protein [Saprospiraceae bacterium]
MSYNWIFNFLILIGMVCLMGTTTASDKKRYQIESGSRLYLKGTSNVNAFTCDCEDQYAGQIVEVDRKGAYARFRNVDLLMKSRNFDCHNRKIDNDMQKALKTDYYPYIKISLVDTWQDPKYLDGDSKEWFDLQANVNITITNVTKMQSIPAKARVLGPNRFQLRGQNALQMSAFGIDPPEAMMGMIKVDDWITFHFDLIVFVEQVQ